MARRTGGFSTESDAFPAIPSPSPWNGYDPEILPAPVQIMGPHAMRSKVEGWEKQGTTNKTREEEGWYKQGRAASAMQPVRRD